MKNTNRWMMFLVLLPVLLLLLLSGWILKSEWKRNQISKVSESESDFMPQDLGEEQTIGITEDRAVSEVETEIEAEGENEKTDSSQVHLIFSGDILLSTHVTTAYDKSGGIEGVLDEPLRAEITQSDIYMANQEFPFSERGSAAPDKQFTFRLSPTRVSMMNEIGVDIVSIANNHTLDYGTDALVDTCNTLDQAGIAYVGAGENMDRAKKLETIEVKGKTIGFLAASRVYPDPNWVANRKKPGMVSGYDPTILLEEIKKAQDLCDYLVVYVHWGVEREEQPKEYQKVLGRKIIDAGGDLVVGSHPHVLQGVEYYKGKPICYSLGNFIFGSSIPKTVMLKADVDFDQDSVRLSLIPGTSRAGYTRKITDEKEIQSFYQYYQNLSFGITVDQAGVIHPENE